jgi:nitroreductase
MFYDLLKSRRSIRKFQSREVEKEKTEIILRSVLLTPPSPAIGPWEFIAVTDRELLKRLSQCKELAGGRARYRADRQMGA